MTECVIREATYLGGGQWAVDAGYTDEGGTRSGPVPVEAPEGAEEEVLKAGVAKAYGAF